MPGVVWPLGVYHVTKGLEPRELLRAAVLGGRDRQ